MSIAAYKETLQNFIKQGKGKALNAVVMPDFFLDRILTLDWDANEFTSLISDVTERKGGSIDGIPQVDIKGGNAVNTTSALASLNVNVSPIICTNAYGLQLLKYHFQNSQVDLSHIKVYEKASITTALELKARSGKANVMLRDVGALANFGPQDLNEKDFALIEKADYVCLFNWAGTKNNGTALAQKIFEKTKQSRKGKTYFDTADPLPNKAGISDLMDSVLKTDLVDILSVNENEAITYAMLLDRSLEAKKKLSSFAELALEAARLLANHLSARIDLHTTTFSASLTGKKEVVVPTFKIEPLRATGAGDAWNAGNILGDGNNLSTGSRLMLANAVSACYLTAKDGTHPSWSKLENFINSSV